MAWVISSIFQRTAMNPIRKVCLALLSAGMLVSGTTRAALHDRGGGLLYDDVLNVTWLQDANYAKTSGYSADGFMDWNAANAWASGLSISRFAGETLTGWRLPTVKSVGADWNYDWSHDGSTDAGYNITSPRSELSYMYYVNLGLKGFDGVHENFGIFGDGRMGGQADVGLVKNLQSNPYWSDTDYAPDSGNSAWEFDTRIGVQISFFQSGGSYAWAVRPGDVATFTPAIPEPETYAMLMAGIGLVGAVTRRRRIPVSS